MSKENKEKENTKQQDTSSATSWMKLKQENRQKSEGK